MWSRGRNNELLLCIDCNLKFQQSWEAHGRLLKEQYNHILDQADAVVGFPSGMPRYDLSQPIVNRGPVNFHSIQIDRSIVGAINTGNIRQMEVALNNVHASNSNPQLESELKKFTELVLQEASLNEAAKNEIIEQLAALTEQLSQNEQVRKTGVVKAFVMSIAAGVASTALSTHWQLIRTILGF